MGLDIDALRARRGIPAYIVAERILQLRSERGLETTHFQLQKLIYIAHGWMLGLHGVPLVRDDIKAWEYGPVIIEVYHRYKGHGSSPIPTPEEDVTGLLTSEQAHVIQKVVDEYNLPFEDLYRITHHEDSPWTKTWTKKGRSSVIPNQLIRDHYLDMIERLTEM
ncbi:MAG: DUF4065 domain-containing protein [Gemmatimonadetes bacterium]|nr:DUF4065 domain-containing protein [Gemmatimonadota bacterium]